MHRHLVTTALTFWSLLASFVASLPSHASAAGPVETAEAVAAIKRLGGSVHRMGKEWEVEFHRGRSLTDDELAQVASLKNIVVLNLRETKVTSAGLVHLKDLANLRWLHLEKTEVGDEGTENLAGLINLEYLNLYATNITDKTLGRLTGLKKLKKLYVWQTAVTDKGVARLEKALPNLKIVRGVDLSKLAATFPKESEEPKPTKALKWIAVSSRADAPAKSLNGINTTVFFENKSSRKVKLYWISYGGGELKLYGELAPGATRRQNTYSKNSWLITDENDQPLGYFLIEQEESLAVIPSLK